MKRHECRCSGKELMEATARIRVQSPAMVREWMPDATTWERQALSSGSLAMCPSDRSHSWFAQSRTAQLAKSCSCRGRGLRSR